MDMITQEGYWRQRVIKYAQGHGVTVAANRYRVSRKTVHKWMKRYNGTVESLKNRPRTPHHSPRAQTGEEIKPVKRYARKYRNDLLLGYEKARGYGYTRSYGCFRRTAQKLREVPVKKHRKRKNKPYQRAAYPGQKIQMDVKFVHRIVWLTGESIISLQPRTNARVGRTGRFTKSTVPIVPGTFWRSSYIARLLPFE